MVHLVIPLTIYNTAMDSVNNNQGKMLIVHSTGGGGKTFVCNTIAAAVRSQGHVTLCVISSGITALLLQDGHTAHSRFKIPISATDVSVAKVLHGTFIHDILKQTKIIIWDEIPMQHKHAADSVDCHCKICCTKIHCSVA